MGVAGTLLTSQVAYGVIVAVLDAGALRRVAHCAVWRTAPCGALRRILL